METRTINEHYVEIGKAWVESESRFIDIANSDATIVYLSSDYAKTKDGKLVLGECEKVAPKNKWAIPADFTITLYEPNLEGKSEEVIKRVIFHELCHVGIEFKEDGTERHYIVPHDYEDFRECITRWGIDWSEE